jgi:hypothetical protein
MCDMDTLSINEVADMAKNMTAQSIVNYFYEKGVTAQIVTGGIYPVGIQFGGTTMFIPALQPKEEKPVLSE